MKHSGFSLIEVNMAVFVLAIGVLSMAALYPLGLRESIQSQADLASRISTSLRPSLFQSPAAVIMFA